MDPAERATLLSSEIVVEEKVDGANIGISIVNGSIRVQNRGTVLETGAHPQFQPLWGWLAARQLQLESLLGTGLILFGEWCYARHTVLYSQLPDWFLAFDVYDRTMRRFWSTERRDALITPAGICHVPKVRRGRFTLDQLISLFDTTASALGGDALEGLYVRCDDGEWLTQRAKLVQAEFVQSIDEHWMSRPLERNKLRC
jgi:ATP-dependent RNA circularization protein (DNA/RNA ligase family)